MQSNTSIVDSRPSDLLEYANNVYSQYGEDGVLGKILDTLPETNRWCVEFGAWDGVHLSNTRHLIDSRDYSAVLIEADPRKFAELEKNNLSSKVITINAFVGFGPDDGLDAILTRTSIPRSFDFLSIDIDGNDYHVWRAIKRYSPKVVCIEFNPTIPDEVDFVQIADPTVQQGSSLSALVELGSSKGYELVAVLHCNAVFVQQQYFKLFDIADNRPSTLRRDRSKVTYLFSGYDGSVHLAGCRALPWHWIPMDEDRFQVLPRRLQIYPYNYSPMQRRQVRLLRGVRSWIRRFGRS